MGNRKGLIIVISGPSGVGKTTLFKKLQKVAPELKYSISYTTRKPRKNEVHSKDYFFVTEDEFKQMIKSKKFLEWAIVHNNYYGTLKKFVDDTISQGKDVILAIDVQGARKIKKIYPKNLVLIFILPPSWEELRTRLYARAKDNLKTIKLRLQNAKKELRYITDYDYLVINDKITTAVKKIKEIINSVHKNKLVRKGEN